METVSSRILEIMNEKNISYGELSKLTGIPKSTLQRYATAQTNKVPVDKVELIAQALNVDAAVLFGWSPDEAPSSNDEDFADYLEELRTRPEKRLLFDSTNGMSPDQIQAIVQMIEKLK